MMGSLLGFAVELVAVPVRDAVLVGSDEADVLDASPSLLTVVDPRGGAGG